MGKGIKFTAVIILLIYFVFCFCPPAKATIVFSISNPIINSDDEIEVDATISGLISSSCSITGCYVQAEIQSAGGYFGYTYNNSGDFVDYFKSPGSTDELKSKLFNFVPISGGWTGKLKAKNNPTSVNYYGPGDYLLTFRRFSGNSLTATSGDSNGLSVNFTAPQPTPTPTDFPSETPSPTPSPTSFTLKTASPTPSPTPLPTKTPTPTPVRTPIPFLSIEEKSSSDGGNISDVLGVQDINIASQSPSATESGTDDNKFPLLAAICLVLGAGFIGFSIFSIIKHAKKSYTGESEKQDDQIS